MRWLALLVFCATAHAQLGVVDDYGHPVRLPAPAQRIVSLAPHLTELVYAAGGGASMVGAVDYSDFPAAARDLPRVGSDAHINMEALLALKPDLVVAWPNAASVRAIDRLAELGLPVFRSEPRELDDIATTIERLGVLTGSVDDAAREARAFRARRAALERRYAARPKLRVFYQVWDRPLVTVNGAHVISKVIALCGGENVFAHLPRIAPEIDAEAVLRAKPEVVLASGQTRAPRWLRKARFAVVPADLIQRHTPRLLDGAEQVCTILDGIRAARS